MFYTPKERIDIGRLVFTHEITKEDAAIPDDKEHYQIITYDKLYEIIGKTKDLYCNELKKEIKNNLMK